MRAAREARFTTDEIHHIRGGVTHLHTYVVVAQGPAGTMHSLETFTQGPVECETGWES